MNKTYDLVVVGAGPVGLYATFFAGLLKLDTLCIESDDTLGGQPKKLYPLKNIHDFPGHVEIKSLDLINNMIVQAQNSSFSEIITNTNIKNFIHHENVIEIVTTENKSYWTKNVLLTVGPGAFEFIKIDNNVFTCEEAKNNVHYTHDKSKNLANKKVLIFGGGDSAVDYALQFKGNFPNCNVSLIHRNEKLRAMAHNLNDLHQAQINVFLNANIQTIGPNYCDIVSNDKKCHLHYDYILVQYGLNSLGSLIHKLENITKIKNKFVVDNNYQTSLPNIFAAGNCAHLDMRVDFITLGMGEASIVIKNIFLTKNPLPNK